jgi:hypothetical protein
LVADPGGKDPDEKNHGLTPESIAKTLGIKQVVPGATANDPSAEFFADLTTTGLSFSIPRGLSPETAAQINPRWGFTPRVDKPDLVEKAGAVVAGFTLGAASTGVDIVEVGVLNALTLGGFSTYKTIDAAWSGYKEGGAIPAVGQGLATATPIFGFAYTAVDVVNKASGGDLPGASFSLGSLAVQGVALMGEELGSSKGGASARNQAKVSTLSSTPEPTRSFAHGTAIEYAKNVSENGLNANAAKQVSKGGGANRPGHFFTHEVGPPSNPGPGLTEAYSWVQTPLCTDIGA